MDSKIKFLDLKYTNSGQMDDVTDAIKNVVQNSNFILGTEVANFEEEWSRFVGAKYSVSVGSGYDALVISLKALGIGFGDEVVVPSNTFIATALAVKNVGAKLILAEPNPSTHLVEIDEIRRVLTDKTKCIIAVNLYGSVVDLDSYSALCAEKNIFLIQDAAQSQGTMYNGKPLGLYGDIFCTSFYPGKNLGAFGDGGSISTNSQHLAEICKKIRNYGGSQKYQHDIIGVNSRLDEIQAAVLRVKLRRLHSQNCKRKEIARIYNKFIRNPQVTLPEVPQNVNSVWHLFVIQTEDRNRLRDFLGGHGIETQIHYPKAIFQHKALSDMFNGTYTTSIQLVERILSIPMGPHLTAKQAHYVANRINDFN